MIDEQELNRLTGGAPLLRRAALSLFVEHVPAQLTQLADLSPVAVAAAAHTLLGSARTVAAQPLAGLLQQLMGACHARDHQEIIRLRSQIAQVADQTQRVARELLNGQS